MTWFETSDSESPEGYVRAGVATDRPAPKLAQSGLFQVG
ncbi:hypothetical protein MPS_4572 [Mycobacterium pseudoshottsii JCM 15466]|nr:hypothetical protein MMSP_0739 [Mycobacterium sp. 012931]GAQ39193.1 hypothetical protein MPS_4572 [Mycobacterium pseudoshottsii JCM 15466]